MKQIDAFRVPKSCLMCSLFVVVLGGMTPPPYPYPHPTPHTRTPLPPLLPPPQQAHTD